MPADPVRDDLAGCRFTVVGGAGFVGRRLAATLQARGAQVWLPQRDEALPWRAPLGHVVYCAGLTADFAARPFDTVQAHVGLLAQVLQLPGWESLVYLSSTRLYDAPGASKDGGLAREDATLALNPSHPRHLYDLSKALGESLCHAAGQGRARVARLACVYDGPQDADGFLPQLVRRAMQAARADDPQLDVDSSPHFARDYVHLPDVVDALIRIALHGRQAVYNVASGHNVSNAALFAYLQRRWGCRVRALQSAAAGTGAPHIAIDRLRDELQWRPRRLFDVMDQWPGDVPC